MASFGQCEKIGDEKPDPDLNPWQRREIRRAAANPEELRGTPSGPAPETAVIPMDVPEQVEADTSSAALSRPAEVASSSSVRSVAAGAGAASSGLSGIEVAEDDNKTDCSDQTRDADEEFTEGETDEERGELAASLEDHFKQIDSMGLLRPPLPRPLQESKRAWRGASSRRSPGRLGTSWHASRALRRATKAGGSRSICRGQKTKSSCCLFCFLS
eukprot:s3736_g5.t1